MNYLRFASEEDAWNYWQGLYEYSGKYEGTGNSESAQLDLFRDWEADNVTYLDDEQKQILDDMWKGVF